MKRVPSAPLWKRFLEKELLTVVWRISLANRLITVASLSNCQGNPLKVKIIKEDNKRHLTAALERRLLTASPRGNPMIGGVTGWCIGFPLEAVFEHKSFEDSKYN